MTEYFVEFNRKLRTIEFKIPNDIPYKSPYDFIKNAPFSITDESIVIHNASLFNFVSYVIFDLGESKFEYTMNDYISDDMLNSMEDLPEGDRNKLKETYKKSKLRDLVADRLEELDFQQSIH